MVYYNLFVILIPECETIYFRTNDSAFMSAEVAVKAHAAMEAKKLVTKKAEVLAKAQARVEVLVETAVKAYVDAASAAHAASQALAVAFQKTGIALSGYECN